MNDRIKELLEQSTEHIMGVPVVNQKRFADMIVKECAEQSISIGRYNTPSGVTPDLSIAIAVGLKKHFGVDC